MKKDILQGNDSATGSMDQLDAYYERFEMYKKLNDLLDKEYRFLEDEDLESLHKVLTKQDNILKRVEKLDKAISAAKDKENETKTGSANENRDTEIDEIKRLSHELIEEIKKKRQQNLKILQQKHNLVGEQLQTLRMGKKTASAYRSSTRSIPSFLDKKR